MTMIGRNSFLRDGHARIEGADICCSYCAARFPLKDQSGRSNFIGFGSPLSRHVHDAKDRHNRDILAGRSFGRLL